MQHAFVNNTCRFRPSVSVQRRAARSENLLEASTLSELRLVGFKPHVLFFIQKSTYRSYGWRAALSTSYEGAKGSLEPCPGLVPLVAVDEPDYTPRGWRRRRLVRHSFLGPMTSLTDDKIMTATELIQVEASGTTSKPPVSHAQDARLNSTAM